jgi:hypothetical protein
MLYNHCNRNSTFKLLYQSLYRCGSIFRKVTSGGLGWLGGIQLSNKHTLETVLYADDLVLISRSVDILHHINTDVKKYNLDILRLKTKPVVMCGNDIRRLKMVIEGKTIKQLMKLKYFGNRI